MAQTTLAAPLEAAVPASDHSFLWRRLHSLTGLIPVGAFMLFHLFENMGAIKGAAAYNESIEKLAAMLPAPYFYLVEIGVIMIPLAFHGLYGAYIALEGKPNVGGYAFRRNWLYVLQRVTGLVALVFLVYHVLALRVQVTMMQVGAGPGGYVAFADVARHYASDGVLAWYVLGTLSCAFHFANGLNGFAWTWGIAVGEKSRKVVEWFGWALFLVTAAPFLHILWSFRNG